MSLRVDALDFKDFRSYQSFQLNDIGDMTVVVGPNAAGKTNIVEGLQLLTALSSFRNATIEQLIRHGEERAHLSAHLSGDGRELTTTLDMQGHSKTYKLNGKKKQASELRGLMPAVVFTPDDLELVKGSMSLRRRALDQLGAQVNANYYIIRRDYEKALAYKNRLLKEEAPDLMLDSIDEMIALTGSALSAYRAALFARLSPYVISLYHDISEGKDSLGTAYTYSWEPTCTRREMDESAKLQPSNEPFTESLSKDEIRAHLEQALISHRAEERARKHAVVGPQKDRVEYTINGYEASLFGSQGQQRSLVLAQKLAEVYVVEEILNKKPLLLLDDVMSELDERRRAALVEHLQTGVQTFITTANLSYFTEDMLSAAHIIEIHGA